MGKSITGFVFSTVSGCQLIMLPLLDISNLLLIETMQLHNVISAFVLLKAGVCQLITFRLLDI
jgi:hypothetical protein